LEGKINTQGRKDGGRREFFRFLGVASTVGIHMVACTFVGFAVGYWLIDSHLGTFPWFTILFLMIGIVAGFRYLFRIAGRASDREGDQ